MDIGGGPTYSTRKEEKTHTGRKQNSWYTEELKNCLVTKYNSTILKWKPRDQKHLSYFLTATKVRKQLYTQNGLFDHSCIILHYKKQFWKKRRTRGKCIHLLLTCQNKGIGTGRSYFLDTF